jgi:uncharacterized protein YdaU (DUF1376 family)
MRWDLGIFISRMRTERLQKKIDETRRLLEEEKAKEEEAEARVKAEKPRKRRLWTQKTL